MSNIYIFSQSIRSGKTTILQEWLRAQKKASGILSPDVDGLRMVYDIATKQYYPLQIKEGKGIAIGRFLFDENGFAKARSIIQQALQQSDEWLVIDEIGRLEINSGAGLADIMPEVLQHFQQSATHKKLLLVVRDYLLDAVIDFYHLQDAKIITASFFQPTQLPPLTGLVLCGGLSSRMGNDKAFICYHDIPQYQRAYEMLQSFCEHVFLSVNKKQAQQIPSNYSMIIDDTSWGDHGPMNGVLTASAQLKNTSLFLLGCDYPYVQRKDLLPLLQARNAAKQAVCYQHKDSGIAEPLMSIYEATVVASLTQQLKHYHYSLRYYINELQCAFIHAEDESFLQSVDTPEEMLLFNKRYEQRKE